MLNVSSLFKEKIKAPARSMITKVNLYLEDEIINLTDNEVIDFELLEELTSNEELPFGGVSANEFVFSVDNIDRRFTPANASGPYYGRIGPGVEVEGFVGLEIAPEQFEYISLGRFTVAEWRAPSQTVEATITAYDRLFDLREETVPMLRLTENETVGGLFTTLFMALGLYPNEYIVDPSLDQIIPYGYTPQGKVGDALSQMSQAGMCTVSVNRQNKIVVSPTSFSGAENTLWTDDDMILSIDNPEKFNAIYGKAAITIHSPSVRRTSGLSKLTGLEIPKGGSKLEKAEFSKRPVINVEDIALKNTAGSYIAETKYGAHQITILIENPTDKAEIVDVEVSGIYCSFTKNELLVETSLTRNKKQLDIDNPLVQTNSHAQRLMDILIPRITDPFTIYEVENRGNPALEIGDVIKIEAPSVKLDDVKIQIIRSTLRYNGSLDGSIVGRKVI